MRNDHAVSEGWASYSTEQLERLLERLLQENGVPLPSVLGELREEIAE